jgi:hypothetical protein
VRSVVAAGAGVGAVLPVLHVSGWNGVETIRPEIGVLGVTALLGGTVYVVALAVLGERRGS